MSTEEKMKHEEKKFVGRASLSINLFSFTHHPPYNKPKQIKNLMYKTSVTKNYKENLLAAVSIITFSTSPKASITVRAS